MHKLSNKISTFLLGKEELKEDNNNKSDAWNEPNGQS